MKLNPQQWRQLIRRVAGVFDDCTACICRIAAERQTSLASLEALPVTNPESFEATIYPDGPVKNNIIVCRVNNETKECWLAKATCSLWLQPTNWRTFRAAHR